MKFISGFKYFVTLKKKNVILYSEYLFFSTIKYFLNKVYI
jgi:hypothetical protein